MKYSEKEIIEWILGQAPLWTLLRENVSRTLDAGKHRRDTMLGTGLMTATVQVLAHRKASATADLSDALSGRRPCFLCKDARPREQKIIPWEGYEILANPYPLAMPHLTIASATHRPQLIAPNIRDMARLTRVLPDMAIFYNGPRCGASAPDHMHFQAVPKTAIDTTWTLDPELIPLRDEGRARLYAIRPDLTPVPFFEIISSSDADTVRLFDTLLAALPQGDLEPMVNVWAFGTREGTRIVIIPRRAHRPSCYGTAEGELTVSPASLEMAGLFTTLSPAQAELLTEGKILEILGDVCLTIPEYALICKHLTRK